MLIKNSKEALIFVLVGKKNKVTQAGDHTGPLCLKTGWGISLAPKPHLHGSIQTFASGTLLFWVSPTPSSSLLCRTPNYCQGSTVPKKALTPYGASIDHPHSLPNPQLSAQDPTSHMAVSPPGPTHPTAPNPGSTHPGHSLLPLEPYNPPRAHIGTQPHFPAAYNSHIAPPPLPHAKWHRRQLCNVYPYRSLALTGMVDLSYLVHPPASLHISSSKQVDLSPHPLLIPSPTITWQTPPVGQVSIPHPPPACTTLPIPLLPPSTRSASSPCPAQPSPSSWPSF